MQLVQYLTERYTELGVKTVPVPFTWRGIAQSNLLAIIPSPSRPADCTCTLPVVLADHFDTAFCEDIFAKSGQRVSNPGADDNLSGTSVRVGGVLLIHDFSYHYFAHCCVSARQ